MRALRPLHSDLPDLCHPRRRARQPARPHLPHQGPARDRPQDRGRGCRPDRPLPELQFLHDDLPLGRRLPPAGRSCAGQDRGDLSPPARRSPHAHGAGPAYRLATGLPPRAQACRRWTPPQAGAEPHARDRAEARRDAGARPGVASPAGAGREARRLSSRPRRRPAPPHGAARRLRRGCSRPADPRSGHPPPEPSRGRRRDPERRRLLRLARPSYGRGGAGARPGAHRHRRLDA